MSRVLIVNMPFSQLRWPSLGPSLLKAALARRGIGCDLAYLNFDFAERVGIDRYYWIADHFAFVLGGERLFAQHYFPGWLPGEEDYFREVLREADPEMTVEDRRDFAWMGRQVGPFLDRAIASIDWSRYAVVGFSTSFQQTMASLCLARRVKQIQPRVRLLWGGAACEGEMGIELWRQFPEVDYAFLGEADRTFPPLVEQILAGGPVRLPPGVAGRETGMGGTERGSGTMLRAPDAEAYLVRDMDRLPYPDLDDYFTRWRTSPLHEGIDPLLFFETSRGCWWGQHQHCLFCGLNGSTLTYRSKSPQRAIQELRFLVDRHDIHRACSADNILDHRYFQTFLPQLAEAGLDLTFAYEMKTNLTRAQVQQLLAAGLGAAQLGIETFVTPLLKHLGKGTTAIQNLQALKWFSEPGIEVKWNLLYGFPNENPQDYAALADLLPSLYHLAPPLAFGQVRMDRFSPYFDHPGRYGMIRPRPHRAFHYVYPFPEDVLRRLAYYYQYDYADGRNPLDYAAPVLEAVRQWQALEGTVTLRQFDRRDGVLILTDTRPSAATFQRRLTGTERQIYLDCDTGRSLPHILARAQHHAGRQPLNEPIIRRRLDRWVAERIMAHVDDRYLSLALQAPSDTAS